MFSFEDEDNVPTAHLIKQLTERCRDAVTLLWGKYVLMVELERADIGKTCELVRAALINTVYICGVSNTFDCLWNLPTAFDQALIASDVSSRLKAFRNDPHISRFRFFSDNLIYHIVSAGFCAVPEVFENSFITRALAILREYDSQHRTETARILRLFLENERNATDVASIMHMHRNTVLYHIERISDLLGISLDDPDTRLQLLLAFKIDDLY